MFFNIVSIVTSHEDPAGKIGRSLLEKRLQTNKKNKQAEKDEEKRD
jgi:hypothetical protein